MIRKLKKQQKSSRLWRSSRAQVHDTMPSEKDVTAKNQEIIAQNGFDPLSSGLWARRASAAPLSCIMIGWQSMKRRNLEWIILRIRPLPSDLSYLYFQQALWSVATPCFRGRDSQVPVSARPYFAHSLAYCWSRGICYRCANPQSSLYLLNHQQSNVDANPQLHSQHIFYIQLF